MNFSGVSASSIQRSGEPGRRGSLTTIYVCIAGINLVALLLGAAINQHLLRQFRGRVEANWRGLQRENRFDDLQTKVQGVDSPANDVFFFHDPLAERAHLVRAFAEFEAALKIARGELGGVDPEMRRQFFVRLDTVEREVRRMRDDSLALFGFLDHRRVREAGEAMALVDRHHAMVQAELQYIEDRFRKLAADELLGEFERSRRMSRLQFGLLGLVLALMAASGWYAHRLSRRLRAYGRALDDERAKVVYSSKMSALGEMAAGIAHEINNPLTIISGHVAKIRNSLGEEVASTPVVVRSLAKIDSTVDRAARIVSSLRALARNAEQEPLRKVNLGQLIAETLEVCWGRFHEHQVELHVPGAEADIEIECRSVQISQVLLNLLNNAFDAVVGRPEPWVAVEVKIKDDRVELLVTDSGPGIPSEIRQRILEPFFTTKQSGKGTGLGLSVSQSLIAGHGGELRLDERSPRTRFMFWIPRHG